MNMLTSGIPLSLYIHIPWCEEKCPYCDFNSHKLSDEFNEKQYVAGLFKDLEQDLPSIWGRSIESIFIGGGTPSLFSGQAIDDLLSGMRSRLKLQPDLEITLESNPGTADADNYKSYKQSAVNRLSIGVQSFNDQQLKKLGRIHDAAEAIKAFHMARNAGFKRINLDLMYALPDQNVQQALEDLQQAINLDPEHISWYQLTIEPNTVFSSHPPKNIPDDDLIWEIQTAGHLLLNQAGYKQYEISAWSKPGEECRHNLNYWQFGDYLGIGAGAHGKITDFNNCNISRTRRKKQPKHWLTNAINTMAETTIIEKQELALEFMLNTMRLNQGVKMASFSERTGLPLTSITDHLNTAQKKGLIEIQGDMLRATPKGMNYLNDLLGLFLTDNTESENSTRYESNRITIKEI
jgi:putative oxygen-independent coproporphyrinogen III oxidase